MPQFDVATFPSQIFWLVIFFTALFFILWKGFIPRVTNVFAMRQDKIEDDLSRAEKLKNEAAEAQQAYEKALAEARAKAQAELKAVTDKAAAEAADRAAELAAQLVVKAKDSEAEINKAREAALANVKTIAAETAQRAAARLAGLDVGADAATKAVVQIVGDQG